jgi:RNA polymerase sigma-70 factor (ECF subfamily)
LNVTDREISAETVDACRRGDRDAFRVLYEAHRDRVYSLALHFFRGDPAAAQDMTQQVFLKLFTAIQRFDGRSAFSTWLHRLVANACLDGARRIKARPEPAGPVRLDTIPASHSQEADLLSAESAATVQAAVGALPPKLRLPILLRYFEGRSYEDIAAALGCSMGTVASRLNRGHRLLAQRLAALRASEVR